MFVRRHPQYGTCILTKYKGEEGKPSIIYNRIISPPDFKIFGGQNAVAIIFTGNNYYYGLLHWEVDEWKSTGNGSLVDFFNVPGPGPCIKILNFNTIFVKNLNDCFLVEYDFEKKDEIRTVIDDPQNKINRMVQRLTERF